MLALRESSVRMAKNFDLDGVGEGIETLDDWACLQQHGCKIGQGYFIAKPMEGERLVEWVRDWNKPNLGGDPGLKDAGVDADAPKVPGQG